MNICQLYICCCCRNVFSVKFPVCVLYESPLWDLNSFSVVSLVVTVLHPFCIYCVVVVVLLFSHIQVDRLSVPSLKCIYSASPDVIVCFIIVTVSVLISPMAASIIFLGACTRRVFPVDIFLSKDVAPVSATCIVSSTSSVCSSLFFFFNGIIFLLKKILQKKRHIKHE